ncbi:M23 family metallopeptidase [Rhodocaloribacter litoris]|nr:M23 family metallopeptidase [Rhodocaloribacter litoris]GIV60821.1 MAG: peptidase M24 [Rhodothermaceae bacterium]
MFSFLSEFIRDPHGTYTVMVMDEAGLEPLRSYRVQPRRLLLGWVATVLGLTLLLLALLVLTPLREWVPGYGTAEMQRSARLNALRLAALQDSLAAQQRYMQQLRTLVLGPLDSSLVGQDRPPEPAFAVAGELAEVAVDPLSKDWQDHTQPALALERLPATTLPVQVVSAAAGERYLAQLRFPVLPPVDGFPTRGFDARTGHYALDIAVEEGSVVRAVGDGHVIFADWTHEGGFTIAVQHADGYVSVYKHNQRLLKRVGDRVRDREAIAFSGNSGEITTGPHLHFELWHNGLAQDPRLYFIGF